MEVRVRHQGLAIFALFFGLSFLEALQGRHWISAAFWLCIGGFFVAMDVRREKPHPEMRRHPRP